jgi:hypothetical protein
MGDCQCLLCQCLLAESFDFVESTGYYGDCLPLLSLQSLHEDFALKNLIRDVLSRFPPYSSVEVFQFLIQSHSR